MNKTNTNYLKYIETIITNEKLSKIKKEIIIRKLLKIITCKIQIYYNEKVLFSERKILNGIATEYFPADILTFYASIEPLILKQPIIYSLNKTPTISYIWRSDRIINSFVQIGLNGFQTQKQTELISTFISPLGIVICSQNNHSTNSGIFDSNAKSRITHTIDISTIINKLKIIKKIDLKKSIHNKKIIKNILIKEPIEKFGIYRESEKIIDCEEILLLIKISQLFVKYNFSLPLNTLSDNSIQ